MTAVLACAVCLFAGRAAAEGLERADELFREGNRAFAVGDARAAYEAYRGAWSLRKSFDIACNLGRTEAELSLSRDAAEHLDYCLRTYPASSRDDLRDANRRFRQLFAEVRARVAALHIVVRKPGAEITVDGASYGTAPLASDVFVDPGEHRVRARLVAFEPEERVVNVAAGEAIGVSFDLDTPARPEAPVAPAVETAPSPAQTPPQRDRESADLRTTVAISGGVLTLVGVGLGTGFLLDARASSDRVDRIARAVRDAGGSACGSGSEPQDCESLRAEVDHENDARARAGVFFTAGAAVGLATVAAWLLLPNDAAPAGARLSVSPTLGRSIAGLTLAGRY